MTKRRIDGATQAGVPGFVKLVIRLLSSGVRRKARALGLDYAFLYMQPSGRQLPSDVVRDPAVAHATSPVTASSRVVRLPSSSTRVTSRTRQRASSRSG